MLAISRVLWTWDYRKEYRSSNSLLPSVWSKHLQNVPGELTLFRPDALSLPGASTRLSLPRQDSLTTACYPSQLARRSLLPQGVGSSKSERELLQPHNIVWLEIVCFCLGKNKIAHVIQYMSFYKLPNFNLQQLNPKGYIFTVYSYSRWKTSKK